jgi:hypothetical protein
MSYATQRSTGKLVDERRRIYPDVAQYRATLGVYKNSRGLDGR